MSLAAARIGLIVPSSNTVMEPDFHRHFLGEAIISTTRIFLEEVTRAAEIRMLEEDLPRAMALIKTTAPDTVVFGCTSAGSLDGLEHDARIARMIEQTGAKAVTILQAVLTQLGNLRPNRIAVFTPYQEDLTSSVAGCIADGGYSVVKTAGMGLFKNLDIGRVTPAEIVGFVEGNMAGAAAAADCVFLSCTNWRGIEAIETLRSKLDIPILSSNQAAIEAVRQAAAATAAR